VTMRGNITFERENVYTERIQLHGTGVQWNSNTHLDRVTSDVQFTGNCRIIISMTWGLNSKPELNGPTHLLVRDEWENQGRRVGKPSNLFVNIHSLLSSIKIVSPLHMKRDQKWRDSYKFYTAKFH
jgi:hypothetical protein